MPRKNTWENIKVKRILDPVTGCRNWSAATNKDGYGIVEYNGRRWYVHKLVYLYYNPNADQNLRIYHYCKNRICSEITHLGIKSIVKNTSYSKKDITRMRRLRRIGCTYQQIANLYECAPSFVWRVVTIGHCTDET